MFASAVIKAVRQTSLVACDFFSVSSSFMYSVSPRAKSEHLEIAVASCACKIAKGGLASFLGLCVFLRHAFTSEILNAQGTRAILQFLEYAGARHHKDRALSSVWEWTPFFCAGARYGLDSCSS